MQTALYYILFYLRNTYHRREFVMLTFGELALPRSKDRNLVSAAHLTRLQAVFLSE